MTELKVDNAGQSCGLYSLRHTTIGFRLISAKAMDTLTLAKNARASQEMIERVDANRLTGEMNFEPLQSTRKKGKRGKMAADDD